MQITIDVPEEDEESRAVEESLSHLWSFIESPTGDKLLTKARAGLLRAEQVQAIMELEGVYLCSDLEHLVWRAIRHLRYQ